MDISGVITGFQGLRYRYGRPRAAASRRSRGSSGGGSAGSQSISSSAWNSAGGSMPGTAASLEAWGYAFQLGAQTVAIGAPVTFSNSGPLRAISHTPGTGELEVDLAGTYNAFFSVFTTQNNPQDWGVAVNGIVRSRFNSAGQAITGAASLQLEAGDRVTIRNVNTLPAPANLRSGEFTTAYLMLNKVD